MAIDRQLGNPIGELREEDVEIVIEDPEAVSIETEEEPEAEAETPLASQTVEKVLDTRTQQVPMVKVVQAEKIAQKLDMLPEPEPPPAEAIKETVLAMISPLPDADPAPLESVQKEPKKTAPKDRFSLDLLRFRLAEKRYNQLIWKGIRKELMFYRRKNPQVLQSGLQAKLRLDIDETGKVIWKKLVQPSRSGDFNRRILNLVNHLDLPPPMDILVDQPPYVVTILIQP